MENPQFIKDKLKQKLKVSLGETIKDGIKILNPNSEAYDEMILHLNKYNQLEKEVRLGTISDSNKDTNFNKLRFSILKTINSISNLNLSNTEVEKIDIKENINTNSIFEISSLNDYFNFTTNWISEHDGEGPVRTKIIQKKCKIISNENRVRIFLDEIMTFSFDYPEDWKIEEPEEYRPYNFIDHNIIEIEFKISEIKDISIKENDVDNQHIPKLVYLEFESYEAGQINICISNVMNRMEYYDKGKLTEIKYDVDEGIVKKHKSHKYSVYIPEENSELVQKKLKKCLICYN